MTDCRFCSWLNIPQTDMDSLRINNLAPTRPPQSRISSLPTTDQELVEQPSCGTRRLATVQSGLGRPVDVVIDEESGNLPTMGISSIPPLRNKGELTIYRRMVETEDAMQLTDEILSRPHLFHQHKFQGFNKERRLQAQFHHKGTDDFDSQQPGYCYNNHTTLKVRPISSIPSLEQLADRLETLCKVPAVWNIGATIVMFRNGRDKLGQHQGR